MAVVEVEVVGAPLEPGADEVSCRRGSGEERREEEEEGWSPFPNSPARQASRRSRSLHSWLEPPAPGTVYLSQQRSDSGGLSLKQAPVSRSSTPGKGFWRLLSELSP